MSLINHIYIECHLLKLVIILAHIIPWIVQFAKHSAHPDPTNSVSTNMLAPDDPGKSAVIYNIIIMQLHDISNHKKINDDPINPLSTSCAIFMQYQLETP